MASHLRPLLAAAALLAACVSNPTPHPGDNDGFVSEVDTAQGSDGDGRKVCDTLGGAFGDDDVCDLGLESNYDAEPSPPVSGAAPVADITAVTVTGDPDAYTFAVTIMSGDTGCDSYADWWEIVSLDGKLTYRRVLAHSHVDEQPFTRSGGPVAISGTEQIVLRAHRNPEGYVGVAFVGSVDGGFVRTRLPSAFATTLDQEAPLPSGCDF